MNASLDTSSPPFDFQTCHAKLLSVMNGTLAVGGVSNETLAQSGWIYDGPIGLLKDGLRGTITAITYKGCIELCGNATQLNSPTTALQLVTAWIFPLAILFNLPYDSLHIRKRRGTFAAVLHWLGSPQTAMTATIFNFDQIRKCHAEAVGGRENTYYVLSCFNQFQLPKEPDGSGRLSAEFMSALVYGLFRPLSDGAKDGDAENHDIEYTKQLLAVLAKQLRLLRRRGVIPTMLSLGSYLIAFILAIYLAFGEVGDGVDVTSLILGLLFSWLPMLLICTVIDRNPISSDRTAALMSRWLYNVNAVLDWKLRRGRDRTRQEPDWWQDEIPAHFEIGDFIGQGRRLEYAGLVEAVLSTMEKECRHKPHALPVGDSGDRAVDFKAYEDLATAVRARHARRRPGLWFWSAIRALFLVWFPVLMAFVVAYTSPTVGMGCWSGPLLMWGALSSFSWFVSLFKRSSGLWLTRVCHFANGAALLFLVFFTCLTLSGAMSNCYCTTSSMSSALPYPGGYMTFESYEFVRDRYDVTVPWAMAASLGFALTLAVFFVEIICWVKCQHLWKLKSERDRVIRRDAKPRANLDWLE
ncbi:hypothetical protein B0T22DRAFT_474369 [Podospora appendiculata]|uniref:Uncharacterized protein n=1 Tax=Podospora appendiculata TaxID=314037 RepID=A0AAE0WYX7_9PEZI|nr:hypothetical protein B0T22DRAFT_474369 [Podospora appendiculata]